MHDHAATILPAQLICKAQRVMALGTALQAVKQHDQWGAVSGGIEPIQVDEIAVGRLPTLAPELQERPREIVGINRLQVTARQPARRAIRRERSPDSFMVAREVRALQTGTHKDFNPVWLKTLFAGCSKDIEPSRARL